MTAIIALSPVQSSSHSHLFTTLFCSMTPLTALDTFKLIF